MWKELQRRGADEDGFTLVELLVVVLIIGLLAALGISSFLSQRSKAQDAEAKQVIRTASHALLVFHMDHDTFDATVADLVQVEPSLGSARNLVVNGTVDTYDIATDSASGSNTLHGRAPLRRDGPARLHVAGQRRLPLGARHRRAALVVAPRPFVPS